MKFLRWFKSRFELAPLNRAIEINCYDDTFELRWAGGTTKSVKWAALQRAVIRTTNLGPIDEDVFFILETNEETFVIPQEAAGTPALVERLQQLPGFDNDAFNASMCCTDNETFQCWEHPN